MKTLSEVLTTAAELLAKGWTGPLSKNGAGKFCHHSDPACVAWDLHGALFRASDSNPDLICDALTMLDAVAPGGSAQLWEEAAGRKQAEVVALVRRAAQRAWRSEQEAA